MKNNLLLLALLFTVSIGINGYGQQQPENPGFELWEEYGFGPDTLEPVNWNSLKSSDGGDFINSVIPVTLERSTDAHSGDYSVKLRNDTILIFVAPGTMTNGRVHATLPPSDAYVYTIDSLPEFNTPFTDLPDSLSAWIKFFPQENDIAHVTAILHSDTAKIADSTQTNWIAVASIDVPVQVDEWTKFSAPFQYLNNNTPEYILFAIYAGDAANSKPFSTMYLDDIQLIYHETGIQSKPEEGFDLGVSGNIVTVIFPDKYFGQHAILEISDLSGRSIFVKSFSSQLTNTFSLTLPEGIYICRIKGQNFILQQKFIKK
jgi:hypothetical protein